MAAAAQLTAGAVAAIAEHADGKVTLQPVLQVVEVRKLPSSKSFHLVLSDGVYTLQWFYLATADNTRVRDGSIREGSIIRLRDFSCHTVANRKVIIVRKLDVLQSDHDIIGNSKPFDMKNVRKEKGSATISKNQGILVQNPWKTVAEIRNSLGYMVKPELFTVKATLSVMNMEALCYASCPLVVNGNRCNGAVSSNGYEWWNCDGCNMTFVACDYRYNISIRLADSTGDIYATTSQEVGEEIFGHTARELYFMKYEKQDHAQYNKIVMGVQNCEYLFDIKLNREAFRDESDSLPMFTIVGMRTGFSDSEAWLQQRLQNFSTGNAIHAAGVRLSEVTDSNSL